jgi:probable phosphoglycerate mutase
MRSQRTLLTLVRHGQTSANIDGVWHGSSDTPLTDHGERQAKRTAAFLETHGRDATVVYSSPLMRARHTAEPIAEKLGLELRIDPDLSEYDIGEWEGKSFQELQEVHQLWHHIATDPDFAPHGGESPRQVIARVSECLRRLAATHPQERIIAVTHGGALAMGLGALLGEQESSWSRVMRNCGVTDLAMDPTPELVSFNLEAHLDGL